MASNIVNNNSKLINNTNNLRNTLYSRNLYNPYNEYPLVNEDAVNRTVEAINSIISGIAPFKTYNLKNTIYGRLIVNPTPLTEVGLIMLGKQFALNSASHISQQTLPIIKPSNLFDGNKETKLFTKKINYNITKKEGITDFQKFLDAVIYYYPAKDYPFNKKSTNNDFIENTGSGQLNFLYSSINRNIYKQNSNILYSFTKEANTQIYSRNFLLADKITFDLNNNKFNPYQSTYPSDDSIRFANEEMSVAYISTATDENWKQEYVPNSDFIKINLGNTIKENNEKNSSELNNSDDNTINSWINTDTEFSNDNILNKVIWGRDGITSQTQKKLSQLQGVSEEQVLNNNQPQNLRNKFNIRIGLLEYTRNLINANEGQIGDITRKVFTKNDKLVGFNGSALWKAPSTSLEEFKSRTGVRQHSSLDQYDRFAKAIRFNGNKIYQGNENSVIYNSVLPRIHPTIDKDGNINNRNLMFSIENLAIGVISKDGVGIIDDEFGSSIPISEVGAFNGRLMWFPPYNIEINEVATAKYESTLMVGRNEPIYNYINSERSATLNFTLLIDYPEQLKNYKGTNKQKAIAEFFAFGGELNTINNANVVENLEQKENNLLKEIEIIQGKTETAESQILSPRELKMVFPNDVPKVSDDLNTIIDKLYIDYHYEIISGCFSSDGTGFGLNQNIYFITGLTKISDTEWVLGILPPSFSQYNQNGISDQFGDCVFNKQLKDIFGNEENRLLYDIIIYGGASKLYTELNQLDITTEENYNKELGLRRATAVKNLINKRIQALFGSDADSLGITVKINTNGSTGSDQLNATLVAIPEQNTKLERYATINIKRNENSPKPKKVQISEEDKKAVIDKQNEIQAIQTKISQIKKTTNTEYYNERTSSSSNGIGDTGILSGFKSISGNYYYPVFHTQTPEDFHKRLTFLQQCTRQGAAKRYTVVDENGVLRARNSVFGKQPICILRIGDFFYTKVIIENVTVDYTETTWDLNPEGFGMQPMMAKVTLQMKLIGGQSLKGPIDALQNAVSFNYYANSTFSDKGIYSLPSKVSDEQESYIKGVLTSQINNMNNAFDELQKNKI